MNLDAAFLSQYEAATQWSAAILLDNWTTLRISGKDRTAFLHNMCTNDVRGLPPNSQCEAFLTDVKGKIVGHVFVLIDKDDAVLVTVPEQAAALLAHLDRYIITEDVRLSDESAQMRWILDVGPRPAKLMAKDSHIGMTKSGVFFAPCTQLWPQGFWMGAKTGNTVGEFVGDAVWHTLRIESGWPLFGVDFDGSKLAQEVGRNSQAINFRKGCYLGQETIARIDALGHVNKQLATVKFAGDEMPAVGAELTAGGQVVGHVTSACWSPAVGSALGLAMLRRGHFTPGTKLECGGRAAEVIATPAVAFEDSPAKAGG